MPVLKSYADGHGHYIHASVRGAVITFQATQRGVEKLQAAGVQVGSTFSLRLLADLTRTRDAYTRHGGVDLVEAEQFTFDFEESEESKRYFPSCAVTGTFDDLHLVVYGGSDGTHVQLLARGPREGLTTSISLSVPLFLLSKADLSTLEDAGKLPIGTEAAAVLRRWYAEDAEIEWKRLREQVSPRQQGFGFQEPGELKL